MKRLPKDYRGIDHVTLGSDLLGILQTLKMPDIVLGKELAGRMRELKPNEWYPIGLLNEVMDRVRNMQGRFGMRQMGRNLFEASHADFVRAHVFSARQFLGSLDDVYRRANRGTDIGGWKLVVFDASRAVLEKNTVHDCVLEEGILLQGIETVGARVTVVQTMCFQEGAEFCRYEVKPLNARGWDIDSQGP